MMDLQVWDQYLKLMEKLGDTLDQLTGLQREKTAAVGRGDLTAVEECMKREQVISLSLRGIDQKREKLLAQLGLTGARLRDLEEKGPRETHMETKAVVERLRGKYELYQSASEVARNTLECNLRAMENIQKQKEAPPPEDQPHQANFLA